MISINIVILFEPPSRVPCAAPGCKRTYVPFGYHVYVHHQMLFSDRPCAPSALTKTKGGTECTRITVYFLVHAVPRSLFWHKVQNVRVETDLVSGAIEVRLPLHQLSLRRGQHPQIGRRVPTAEVQVQVMETRARTDICTNIQPCTRCRAQPSIHRAETEIILCRRKWE